MTDDTPHTLYDRMLASLDEETGGRYAKRTETIVTGVPHEPLPTVAWSRDLGLLAKEPPLGERVDDVPNLLAAPGATPPQPSPSPSPGRAERPGQPSLIEDQNQTVKGKSDEQI